MWEGSRIHKRIQKSKGANYHAEVPLKIELSEGDYTLAIEGRADGIEITCDGERQLDFSDNFNHLTVEEDMHVTIDEIKGIYMNLDALDEPVACIARRRCVMPISMPCSMILQRSPCS